MPLEFIHTKNFNKCYKKHHHPMLAISALKKGKVRIVFDDREVLLLPGNLAVFNPYENHKTTNISKETEDYYTLYCDAEWCKSIQQKLFQNEFFLKLKPPIIQDQEYYKFFLLLFDSDKKEIYRFFKELFNDYCSIPESEEILGHKSKVLQKVKSYLKNTDYKTVTVASLARYAGVSPNYLMKLFKKEYGLSPHAYIINQKVYKSKKLLARNLPIAEVALELGFFDQSHFHKAFKSVYAVTPKEFQTNRQKVTFLQEKNALNR